MKIIAVIVRVPRQEAEVERLASFIKNLDGSDLKIIDKIGEEKPYPARNNYAFNQAALEMKGEPFIWMEPDSIPLKSGWIDTLSEAYFKCGKEFLLSSDVNPPCDLVGGIGVYGPNTYSLIPRDIPYGGWDYWMSQHLKSLTEFSPLIQHTYGNYPDITTCYASFHRFPQENHIIRDNAVLFHADKFQDLIHD